MSDWQEVLLEDLATEITVGYVGPMAAEYKNEGIQFLRSQNVEPFRINLDDTKYISPEFHARLQKSALAPGDVVIVRTGKPGACAVIPDGLTVANCSDLVIVRCGPRLDAKFLMYYVNTVATAHINAHLVGAVQQHFNVGAARKLALRLPSLTEQQSIARVLADLDDKIELNRRMNETLEAMARAIFQSWFVDFDPVRAKAGGESPDSICQRLGLTPELLALFPETFDESSIGVLPSEWAVSSVGALADVVGGSTPNTKEPKFWEEGLHAWATPKDLSRLSTPVLLDTERKVTEAGLTQIGSGLLAPGTVLMSSRAPIGYRAINELPVAINQGFIAMKPFNGISRYFLLYWAEWALQEIVSRANGSTFLEISKSSFRPIPVVRPPGAVFAAFDQVVHPLYQRLVANEKEILLLTEQRDTLLPELLKGKTIVPAEEAS